jgi:hypothetical protein
MPTTANAHPRALVTNVDANAQLMLTLMLAFPTSIQFSVAETTEEKSLNIQLLYFNSPPVSVSLELSKA